MARHGHHHHDHHHHHHHHHHHIPSERSRAWSPKAAPAEVDPLPPRQALYSQTFEAVVAKFNSAFAPAGAVVHLGVVDLPGFENLPVNGFDQLLVNLAAEKLQVHTPGALSR